MNKVMFISPIYITLSRAKKKDKKVALNLNVYRNLHYLVNNQVKKLCQDIMGNQLATHVFNSPISIEFVLYKSSERKVDRSNILCIVEKFFCDALTYWNCIPDDNDDYIKSTCYRTGGIDSKNPRVEIFISTGSDNGMDNINSVSAMDGVSMKFTKEIRLLELMFEFEAHLSPIGRERLFEAIRLLKDKEK